MSIHVSTVATYIRRSPYQALAGIVILVLTFFVATLLAVLVYASSNIIHYFETKPQIIAYLKNDATSEDVSILQRKIAGDPRVKDVRYVSKEEALNIYKQFTADNPLLSELVNPSIFPASLEFSVAKLDFAKTLISQIEKEPTVEQVDFTASLGEKDSLGDVIERLKQVTGYFRTGGVIIVSTLAVVSLLILLVITGMRIATRREEIEILRLIGASSGFIRVPFVLEALVYATVGAVLGWLLALTLVLYITPPLKAYFGQIPVLPPSFGEMMVLFAVLLAAEVLVASILGIIGSLIAISRFLKV